jgi:hypothetical protein
MITWKKGFFSRTTKLFSDDKEIGFITTNFWNQTATAKIFDESLFFEKRNWYSQDLSVHRKGETDPIGLIKHRTWSSAMDLEFKDESNATLKPTNFWNSKWSLQTKDGAEIHYKGSSQKGSAEFPETVSTTLLLVGVHAIHQSWQYAAVVAAITTIIISSS